MADLVLFGLKSKPVANKSSVNTTDGLRT